MTTRTAHELLDMAYQGEALTHAEVEVIRSAIQPIEAECSTCGEIEDVEGECSGSKRSCGHHCNHIWEQDKCCWCPAVVTDAGDIVVPQQEELREEWAIRWDDEAEGYPLISKPKPTREEAELALAGSVFSGRIVKRYVRTGEWVDD